MAIATVRDIQRAEKTGKPADGANFTSKSERKRVRKSMIRGFVTNKVSDVRLAGKERAEFYKKLRLMKLRRRKIATELASLADMMSGLNREVVQVGDRINGVDGSYLGPAYALGKKAASSVGAAADEFWSFSRARVFFTQKVGS